MPSTPYPVTISNEPMHLSSHQPYGQHFLVGGNAFMLKLFKSHGAQIGVTASAAEFDSTIARISEWSDDSP